MAHAIPHTPWQGTDSIGRIRALGAYLAILSLSQPWVWTWAYTLGITLNWLNLLTAQPIANSQPLIVQAVCML